MKQLNLKRHIMERLTEVPMSIEECSLQLIAAFGDANKSFDDQPQTVKNALRLFEGQAKGADYITAYQTCYGALQAVTEHFNHHTKTQSLEAQFASVISGDYAKAMNRFEKQLVQVANR
jgi:hypothetical protein